MRRAAPDAATLYAVYEDETLSAFTDERQLLKAALADPAATARAAASA